MDMSIRRALRPEEQELEEKRARLTQLEAELADKELELATLQNALQSFANLYRQRIGVRFARLDALLAEIAILEARINPSDQHLKAMARQAYQTARRTAEEVGVEEEKLENTDKGTSFKPTASLKRLFREVAKRIHPDLATTESERQRRTQLMSEANCAYEQGDEAALSRILSTWEDRPESVSGEGIGAELIRVIRKIKQVESRLTEIGTEIAALMNSELYLLKMRVDEAQERNIDLLGEMQQAIDRDIAAARVKRDELKSRL